MRINVSQDGKHGVIVRYDYTPHQVHKDELRKFLAKRPRSEEAIWNFCWATYAGLNQEDRHRCARQLEMAVRGENKA